ncbi:hypothetical protein LB504_010609 [Fusarium proliferatum]|nr:hypothetical protein LB504_010609 [Fusarium proliferatum]
MAKGLINYFLVKENLSLLIIEAVLKEGKLFKDLKADIIKALYNLDIEAKIIQDIKVLQANWMP